MVAHDGGNPTPSASNILEWDGDMNNPTLLLFEKQVTKRRRHWKIIGFGYSSLFDTDGELPPPFEVDGISYPFLIHEADYHPVTNGGFNCADNGNLKTESFESGKRIDSEGRISITRDDMRQKPGQVKHGRVWTMHIWFDPDTGNPVYAKTDPWHRSGAGSKAVGDCAFYLHTPIE